MEITGKITKVMDVVTGNGKKGPWAKMDFILGTTGQYEKSICISLWGEEKITKYDLEPGLTVTAHIDIESRENNGRWYTEIRAWKITWKEQDARRWEPNS